MEYTATKQKGKPGHCYQAQVFKDGKAFINIEPTKDESEATATAIHIASLLNKSNVLQEVNKKLIKTLEIASKTIVNSEFDSLSETIMYALDQAKAKLK